MPKSRIIVNGNLDNAKSRLIKAMTQGIENLEGYETKPNGVFDFEAKIICGAVTLLSNELDFEFTVQFDDDMEANETEIVVYNLSQNTIKQLKKDSKISIEAGYKGDTGVVFNGYITRVKTKREEADKVTTIKCLDDIAEHDISETTFAAGTKASTILKTLLNKTGLTVKVFNMRRDHTYDSEQKVDGDLMENIKKFSEVCGVSTYIKNGVIYSRHIKEGDNIYFELTEETGLIGSPEEFEEEVTAEDFTETINGYECESLFQHRFAAGGIVKLKSLEANGEYRICSGTHTFNSSEAISKIKMY